MNTVKPVRTILVVVLAVVSACSDGSDLTVEEACADQAEVFCGKPCFDSWDECRAEYTAGCENNAVAPTEDEHVACLEAMSEDNLCTYPISVPAVCWLND